MVVYLVLFIYSMYKKRLLVVILRFICFVLFLPPAPAQMVLPLFPFLLT